MKTLMNKMRIFLQEEDGVTAIEYGLIAALISVVIIAAVDLVGTNLDVTFDKIGSELGTANAS